MTDELRILVVDDHPMFRTGVVAMLNATAQMTVVGEAADGESAVALFDALRPDVTVLDLGLPDTDGVAVIAALRRLSPACRVVVLTTYGGDGRARRALNAGAQGYLLKTSVASNLIGAVRTVHEGRQYMSASVARQLAAFPDDETLTERELDVLRAVAEGLENKQIAVRLSVSPETVKEHVSNAMGKLRANNRTHAVSIALERGFLR
jgi:DNA-binding NarL/FixJ family response regulator